MAEMDSPSVGTKKKRSGVQRSKKKSTRVDLTPMVDLGFLLITFFIFTTTMSRPKTLPLKLPKDSPDPTLLGESGALTLIPSGNNRLFYYEGKDPLKMQSATFNSLREVIRTKQIKTDTADFMVIIKPTRECNYKNTIAMLDEMAINQVRRYALVDLSKEESEEVTKMENLK